MTTHALRRPSAALAALLLATLTALTALAVTAPPASAHAALVGANPEDGATVERPPTEVVLEFSEEVSEPAFVSVTTADGIDVTGGAVAVDGATVTRPLAAAAAAGEYTIAYRVVSADGHPIEGETTFTASEPAAAPKASTQPREDATEPAPSDAATDAAPSDEPTTADTEPAASQTEESDEGGVSTTVVVVAVVAVVAVVTLLMLARRRGNRTR
ncbi:copper resistance protein CopC [uncultured Nocardioides sp.]|uniref:copper resistance CopC family protein n=1 Tax=uncultured Nocardioides sp. TaxID=198441 RepID=UPI00261E1849|nr:copper resistance protein CopC [uncultured Nocardioides sp.]